MNLRIEQYELFEQLQLLGGAVAPKTTLPILSNVMIVADAYNGIQLEATNLEIGISTKVNGHVDEEGTITVSAKKLAEIVRILPSEEVTLKTTANDRVQLECGTGMYKLIGLPADDFPDIKSAQRISKDDYFSMPGDELCSLIQKTYFCAASDTTRYFLNGLHLSSTQEKTTIAGTDGRRLAVATSQPLFDVDDEAIKEQMTKGVIIPLNSVTEIPKLFDESETVKIWLSDNIIVFADDIVTFSSRLVEGDFPNYRGIIPSDNPLHFTVSKEDAMSALRRVSTLSNPRLF